MGSFKEGKPHGFGNWTNGEIRYEGDFEDGKRHGQGRISNYKDGSTIFEGTFRNDVPQKAGWQRKPVYNPDTNTEQSLGTTEDPIIDEEQEVITVSLSSRGFT